VIAKLRGHPVIALQSRLSKEATSGGHKKRFRFGSRESRNPREISSTIRFSDENYGAEQAVANRLRQESTAKRNISHTSPRTVVRDPRIWKLGFFLLITFATAYAYSFTAPDVP
jgi:hypothetical protein